MDAQRIDTLEVGILGKMDATEISNRIKKGDFTVEEAIDCVRERAKIAEPEINSIVADLFDTKVDYSHLNKDACFYGVPSFIKDLVPFKGLPTRYGSRAVPDSINRKHDEYIGLFESTGSVILGKSATSEFGFLPSTETLVNGISKNPLHLEFSTGGSSGGAGAIVAAGITPIAHTMDGGGSTRIPASCCGLIGLKPTRGRHSASLTKNLPVDINTHGIVSRTVRDTVAYYEAITKATKKSKLPRIANVKDAPKKRLRIAMYTNNPTGVESHPEVVAATHKMGAACEALGHEVAYIDNPFDEKVLMDFILYYSFLASMNNRFGRLSYHRNFNAKLVEPFTKELGEHFTKVMVMAPFSIKRLRNDVLKTYNKMLTQYDVFLSPVLASPVAKLGHFGTDVPTISMIMRLNAYATFTMIQNITGTPAIALPADKCANGLPLGIQFGAKKGEEQLLLELTNELNSAKALYDFF